jgi:hypothetical protein
LNFLVHKLYFGLGTLTSCWPRKLSKAVVSSIIPFFCPMKLTNHLHTRVIHLGVIKDSNSWPRICPNRLRDTVNPWIRTFYQYCCFLSFWGFSLLQANKSILFSAKGKAPKAYFKSTTLKHLKSCGILLESHRYLIQSGIYFVQLGWWLLDPGLIYKSHKAC